MLIQRLMNRGDMRHWQEAGRGSDNVIFSATGITKGDLLEGISRKGNIATTETLRSGTDGDCCKSFIMKTINCYTSCKKANPAHDEKLKEKTLVL